MHRRRRARQVALQVLYQEDLNPESDRSAGDALVAKRLASPELLEFARHLIAGVRHHRDTLDRLIQETADNWSLGRMAATDRNVLRLGAYEILHGQTPDRVAINEAVELAKRFGGAQSGQFVNGILDRLMHQQQESRGAKSAKHNLRDRDPKAGRTVASECCRTTNRGDAETRRENQITEKIIGAAIEVHRALGPGLLESAYEQCLCHELALRGLSFRRQVDLPVEYKGMRLDCGYKIDIVVEDLIVVELKTVEELVAVHEAQLLTYLKLSGRSVGLLINFNVPVLKEGIKRMVLDF